MFASVRQTDQLLKLPRSRRRSASPWAAHTDSSRVHSAPCSWTGQIYRFSFCLTPFLSSSYGFIYRYCLQEGREKAEFLTKRDVNSSAVIPVLPSATKASPEYLPS